VGDVKARDFLKRRLKEKEVWWWMLKVEWWGNMKGFGFIPLDKEEGGSWVGEHKRDLPIREKRLFLYVIEKRVGRNELVVGVVEEAMREKMRVGELNWIKGKIEKGELGGVKMRIRHTGELIECEIEEKRGELLVEMKKGQKGVAAGQKCGVYKGKNVWVEGVIE